MNAMFPAIGGLAVLAAVSAAPNTHAENGSGEPLQAAPGQVQKAVGAEEAAPALELTYTPYEGYGSVSILSDGTLIVRIDGVCTYSYPYWYCYCECVIEVPPTEAGPPGYIRPEEGPDGGGGAGWAGGSAPCERAEGTEPLIWREGEDGEGTDGPLAAFLACVEEFSEPFPAEVALDVPQAEALIAKLRHLIGSRKLTERGQRYVLDEVSWAGRHPELSDEARDALRDGLVDYWHDAGDDLAPALELSLRHALAVLEEAGSDDAGTGVDEYSAYDDLPGPPELAGPCFWECDCDLTGGMTTCYCYWRCW